MLAVRRLCGGGARAAAWAAGAQQLLQQQVRWRSALVADWEESVARLPHREAFLYRGQGKDGGRYSAQEIAERVELSCRRLLDNVDPTAPVVQKGEVVFSWMEDGEDKHMLQMVCAKLGAVMVDADMRINATDELRDALYAADPHFVVMDPRREDDVDPMRLIRTAVPEFFYYDHENGDHFHSKYFQRLRGVIVTGDHAPTGCYALDDFFRPRVPDWGKEVFADNLLSLRDAQVRDADPLLMKITKTKPFEVEAGSVLTHEQVRGSDEFPVWKRVQKNEHVIA